MKKQFTNRILSLVLAFMLIVGMMPITAFAAESGVTGELSYTLDDNGVLTISGSGAIGVNAFANRSDIYSVIVSDGITAISNYAFYRCSFLEKVTVLGEIEAIGNYAFANCTSLTTFEYWGTTVPSSASSVFARTSLLEVQVTEDYEDDVFARITVSKTLGGSSEPEKEKYTVTATVTPVNSGIVSGSGEYEEGNEVTLIATANDGYVFVGWTKNGVEVSTNAKCTFTVTANCDLVAVFEEYNPYSGECGEHGDNALRKVIIVKYKIELTTLEDVKEFTQIVQKVREEVRVSGMDEHGSHWSLSAKSMLCVFLLGGHIQHILHADQNIDWNAIYCESEGNIYPLIKKFVKE